MKGVETVEVEVVRLAHARDLALPDYATAAAAGVEDWPTLAKGEVAMRLAGRIALHFGRPPKAEAAE